MKNISLPNKELRLLSGQLQNFNQGYTVAQIRSLDKIVRQMEEVLKPFMEGLNKIINTLVSNITPEEKAKDEEKKQKDLEEFIKTVGEEKVTISFEDADFDFINLVWSRMGTLSGSKEAREAVIKIDDAIQVAKQDNHVIIPKTTEKILN